MSDPIDRKEAIDAVHKNYDGILDFYSDGKTISFSIEDILSALPSARQWIPCSETIDIPNYEVLACDKYGGMIIGYLRHDKQWVCESETEIMYEPLAWMPLPEPYKRRQNEQSD